MSTGVEKCEMYQECLEKQATWLIVFETRFERVRLAIWFVNVLCTEGITLGTEQKTDHSLLCVQVVDLSHIVLPFTP